MVEKSLNRSADCYYRQRYSLTLCVNTRCRTLKHILKTSSTEISLDDAFYTYFMVENGYRILIRDDLDFEENFAIKINLNEICRDKDIENKKRNEYIPGFVLKDLETEEETRFDEKSNNPIYIGDQLMDILSDKIIHKEYDEEKWVEIRLDELDPEDDVFFMQFSNDEITRPLTELKSMIEKGKEIDGVEDISSLINKINKLMKEGKINTECVHVEVICRNLIRDADNPTKLPDYTEEKINPMFISIHNSILTNNSVITGFTFERLGQQLRNPETYYKTGSSIYDRLFMNK